MKKRLQIKRKKTKLRPKKWVKKALLTLSMVGMIINSNGLEIQSMLVKKEIFACISEFNETNIKYTNNLKLVSIKAISDFKEQKRKEKEKLEKKKREQQLKKENAFKYETIALKNQYRETSQTKTYMDLNKITKRGTKQYSLKNKYKLDNNGVYYFSYKGKKFYTVALGSYFGEVGTKYKVTLSSGQEFYCIKADEKSDNHTIDGYAQKYDGSVIEFVINTNTAFNYYGGGNGYVLNGNFNNHNDWNGSIISMKKVV